METAFVEVEGVRTHYLSAGESGPVVVLLHGGGIDSARLSWGHLVAGLAGRARVIAPDWPGYGESDRCPGECTVEYLVNFLDAFLNRLGIERAALAGISMGGSAALGFALRCPERVERLVLVDSYGLQRKAPLHILSWLFVKFPGAGWLTWQSMRSQAMVRWSLQALLVRPGAVTQELVDQAMAEIRRPAAGRAWSSFQNSEITLSGTRTCYLDRLHELRPATLIIHGTRDSAVHPDRAREAHIRIHDASLHWMEDCGHWPQRDDPEEFERALGHFLFRA